MHMNQGIQATVRGMVSGDVYSRLGSRASPDLDRANSILGFSVAFVFPQASPAQFLLIVL